MLDTKLIQFAEQSKPVHTLEFPDLSSCWGSSETGYCLTSSGKLLQFTLGAKSYFTGIPMPIRISQVAVGYSASLFISVFGQTYVMGIDPCKSGVLGIPGVFALYEPTLIQSLVDCTATHASISVCHGGIVDESGSVFTWGVNEYGQLGHDTSSSPSQVSSLNAHKIACGNDFTAICTRGGFVYVFGKISFSHKRAIDKLDRIFAEDLVAGDSFVAVLTVNSECIVFDECRDPETLPIKAGDKINRIFCSGNCLYGTSVHKNVLYKWKTQEGSCVKESWTGEVYNIDKDVKFLNGNLLAISTEIPKIELESKLEAYKRTGDIEKIAIKISDSNEVRSPRNNELERLFAFGNNEKTIAGIIKCRKQFIQLEKFQVFIDLLHPILQGTLENIKEQARLNHMSKITYAAASIPNIIMRIFQRDELLSLAIALKTLKFYSRELSLSQSLENLDKEANVKALVFAVNNVYLSKLLVSFSKIRDIELDSMQQELAISGLFEPISRTMNRIIARYLNKWKEITQTFKFYSFVRKVLLKQPFKELKLRFYRRNREYATDELQSFDQFNVGANSICLKLDNSRKKVLKRCFMLMSIYNVPPTEWKLALMLLKSSLIQLSKHPMKHAFECIKQEFKDHTNPKAVYFIMTLFKLSEKFKNSLMLHSFKKLESCKKNNTKDPTSLISRVISKTHFKLHYKRKQKPKMKIEGIQMETPKASQEEFERKISCSPPLHSPINKPPWKPTGIISYRRKDSAHPSSESTGVRLKRTHKKSLY